MSKKPIKSSLFRFVTLRSPQAIEDKETKIGLIYPSGGAESDSAYYQAVSGVTEGDETGRETALKGVTFTTLDTKTAIKDISFRTKAVYGFSTWLMRNKNNLSYALVADNLPSTYLGLDVLDPDPAAAANHDIALSPNEEAQVWDNLLYQTINKTSTSLRESFIQMLVANKFAQEFKAFHDVMNDSLEEGEIVLFTDQDEEDFRKRANASVVIEKRYCYLTK